VHAGCGGCQWQHVSYAGQLAIKRELVERELAAAGVDRRVDAVHGLDDPWRYRRTAAIALGWEAGFRPRGRRGIVEIRDCLISHPRLGHLAAQLNDVLRRGLLPNYHGKVWLDCTVVDGEVRATVQVVIQGITGLTQFDHPELPDMARTISLLDGVASVAYRHRNGEVVPLVGPLTGVIRVCGVPLRVPAGAFFQTNVVMLERVIGRMRDVLAQREIGHAADVYGGVGTFAFTVADRVQRVTLIELDAQSVAAARETALETRTENLNCLSAHAERALSDVADIDLAIVDPPRSGLGSAVVGALAERTVPLIFYVSCAPRSLAVDLAEFRGHGYEVRSLELFDFYPQTYHVESLAVLER
jgi:23S rRNA (uracil1939-C5)-methyltransferase